MLIRFKLSKVYAINGNQRTKRTLVLIIADDVVNEKTFQPVTSLLSVEEV